jgi:hypothetical protein
MTAKVPETLRFSNDGVGAKHITINACLALCISSRGCDNDVHMPGSLSEIRVPHQAQGTLPIMCPCAGIKQRSRQQLPAETLARVLHLSPHSFPTFGIGKR